MAEAFFVCGFEQAGTQLTMYFDRCTDDPLGYLIVEHNEENLPQSSQRTQSRPR